MEAIVIALGRLPELDKKTPIAEDTTNSGNTDKSSRNSCSPASSLLTGIHSTGRWHADCRAEKALADLRSYGPWYQQY